MKQKLKELLYLYRKGIVPTMKEFRDALK